jgi:hypothetical protein
MKTIFPEKPKKYLMEVTAQEASAETHWHFKKDDVAEALKSGTIQEH